MLAIPTISMDAQSPQRAPNCANVSRFLGLYKNAKRDPLHFFLRVSEGHDIIEIPNLLGRFYVVRHPDLIAQVLRSKHTHYQKSSYYKRVRPLFGDGLFELEGNRWRKKRQQVQPSFHKKKIDALASSMVGQIVKLLDDWETASTANRSIDIVPSLMHMSFSIVSQSLCGDIIPGNLSTLSNALEEILQQGERLLWSPLPIVHRFPSPRKARVDRALRLLDDTIQRLIDARIERPVDPDSNDLLGDLLAAECPETGKPLTRQELRDDLMTMLIAGHETTALAIAWACYHLSKHPEILRKLRSENAGVLEGRLPTLSDLSSMPYNLMVLQETLRLFPPFWTLSRQPVNDSTLGSYCIPAGSTLMVSPYVIHRDPALWDNPEGFDPDRFSAARSATRHPYAYIPFGAGPRVCIGRGFALLEAQLCLAAIVQRFSPELAPGYRVEAQPMISLRPRYGIRMSLRKAVLD